MFSRDWLILIDKPAGLLSHSTLDRSRPNLLGILRDQGVPTAILLNRLDKDTSGLLAVLTAKDSTLEAEEMMAGASKFYLACVSGHFPAEISELKHYIKEDRTGVKVVRSGGKVARTSVLLCRHFGPSSLLLLRLHTGRRHQIRLQLSTVGFPVIGDEIYGKADPGGLLLHSFGFFFAMQGEKEKVFSHIPDRFLPHLNQGREELETYLQELCLRIV